MNRTERRLARKRDGVSGGLPGSAENTRVADVALLFSSALEHFRSGRTAQANDLGKKILGHDPNHAQALNLLGVMAQQAGRNRAAVKLIGQAIALDPVDPAFHYNVALAHQALGGIDDALSHYNRAVCLGLKDQTLLVRDNVFVDRCMRRIDSASPRRLTLSELFGDDGINAFAADNLLFRCLLQSGYADDHILERLLTELRAAVLRNMTTANANPANAVSFDDDTLIFLCALAQQCFNNGYVFAVGGSELESVGTLQHRLVEQFDTNAQIDPLLLILIASYAPLHALPMADAIAEHIWPEYVLPLISQQLHEPRVEREIIKLIQSLTSVEDNVSQQVQQQYEESPYPAWTNVSSVKAQTPDQYVSEKVLRTDLAPFGDADVKNILVAGCGTGRHSINVASSFPEARVLAIDISRTSLAYAIRKTRELDIDNIEYAHADILKLGSIGRAFDLIESVGVLHHLSDPAVGLRALLSLLKPSGIIGIGLYSERARRSIVAARNFIAARGYRPTIEDIRACRQELTRRSNAVPSESVVIFRDFFDTSGCRDLLFNVMEHRFTIAQIKEWLRDNGLTFLGFETSTDVRAKFVAQFPDKESLTDLGKWDLFEAAHPQTFISMYIFYAQKAA